MEQIGKGWFDLWMESSLRAFSFVVGVEQLKMFAGKSAEAFMALSEEYGAPSPSGATIDHITNSTILTINALGAGKVDWKAEKNGEGSTLKIGECPFSKLCSTMLSEIIMSGRIDKSKAPCMMSELACGACKNSGIKCRTTLTSFAPGSQCISEITKVEV
jgi:hypothetical protein